MEVEEVEVEEGEEERLLCRSVDMPERIIDFSRGRGIPFSFFLLYLSLVDRWTVLCSSPRGGCWWTKEGWMGGWVGKVARRRGEPILFSQERRGECFSPSQG